MVEASNILRWFDILTVMGERIAPQNVLPVLPPGVSRGKDYAWQKKPVEERRNISAARVVSKFPDVRADLCMVEYSSKGFLDLPVLAEGDTRPLWMPRYDPISGAVFTSRWQELKTTTSFEGQKIAGLENYLAFGGKKHKQGDLLEEYLPKSWKIVQLIPQKIESGIEAALRQQDEIAHDYGKDGVEKTAMDQILECTDKWASVIKENKVDEEEVEGPEISFQMLDYIAKNTERVLVENGIQSPTGVIKGKIADALVKAARKDRLNRVNELVSRTLLASAYLNAVRGEVVCNLTLSKAEKVLSVLYLEREMTRRLLGEGADLISYVAGLDGAHSPFPLAYDKSYYERRPDKITGGDVTDFISALRGISRRCFRPVRVAPYLLTACLAESWLTDVKMLKINDQRRIINTLFSYELEGLGSGYSAEVHMRMRHPERAIEKLRQTVSLVRASLNDPDSKVYTVFTSQLH